MKQSHRPTNTGTLTATGKASVYLGSLITRSARRSVLSALTAGLIALITPQTRAQNVDEPSYLGNSKYLEITAGTGLGRLRDFATSPLYYEGLVHRIGGSLTRLSERQDISTNLATSKGNLQADYNEHEAKSSLTNIYVSHARLYQIFGNGAERWNFKVGGEASVSGNLRTNPSLMNAGIGIEAFPTLFGTFKVTKDLTRENGRRGREPKKKSLAFKLNASIIGTSYRNGYSYLGIGQVVDKPGLEGLLDDYRFKAFGSNSLSTSLDYTIWLKNKNGWRFSYAWDAYKTRKDFSDFEMASHTLRVTVLFNTKN